MNITATDWIQAISMLLLVIVTGIYSWRTHVMSKATKEQAEASIRMAEEMREQRLSETRPYMTLRLDKIFIPRNIDYLNDPNGVNRISIPISIKNCGSGPALNISVTVWQEPNDSCVIFGGYLSPGESWNTSFPWYDPQYFGEEKSEIGIEIPWLREIVMNINHSDIFIAIRYQDIHDRTWLSYLNVSKNERSPQEYYLHQVEQKIIEIGKT